MSTAVTPSHSPTANTGGEIVVDRFDRITEWMLIALLALSPLAFGAVEPWSRLVVFAVVTAMSGVLLVKLIVHRRTARFEWTWAYLPIVLFVALTLLQLLPLPISLANRLSPQTWALKSKLLEDAPGAERVLDRPTLSFYPHATRDDLRLILAAAAVFVVVVNTYRRSTQIRRLLAALAIIAGALATLALAQDLSGTTAIYWSQQLPVGQRATGGPFVNHSHFAQFVNLALGATLGLLLVELQAGWSTRKEPVLSELFTARAGMDARRIALLALILLLGAMSVLLSLSRGGVIALLAASAVTALVLLLTRGRRGGAAGWLWALGGIGLVIFACAMCFAFDPIFNRFATAQDIEHYGGRVEILRDNVELWKKFPLFGTGLGSYATVFPIVDKTVMNQVAEYAENDYAQLMEEIGAVGVAIVALFVAILVGSFVLSLKRRRAIHWCVFGLGFALVAVMVHSFSDFGQHMPAIAMLSATVCGLIVALPRLPRGSREIETQAAAGIASAPSRFAALAGIAAMLLLTAAIAAGLPAADAARRAAAHWRNASLTASALAHVDWLGSNDMYDDLISEAWLASDLEPDNVVLRYHLSEYRWRAIDRSRDEETGELETTPETLAYTAQVVRDLHEARLLCPSYGPCLTLAGQLEIQVLGDTASGAEHIRAGYRLSPQDAVACFLAGQLEVNEKNLDAAMAALRRAVALDNRMLRDSMNLCLAADPPRPDLAMELAIDKPDALLQLAEVLKSQHVFTDVATAARQRAFDKMQRDCQADNAPAGELGELAQVFADNRECEKAMLYYRRAIAADYGRTEWHLRLARLLADKRDIIGAEREARVCLELNPQDGEAQRFLVGLPTDLTTMPTTAP
jgi:O-antigen ligase